MYLSLKPSRRSRKNSKGTGTVQILSATSFAGYLYLVIHLKLQHVKLPKIIEQQTPDFFHTFTVNFTLAPVDMHPLQYGIGNLEMVYCWQYDTSSTFLPFSINPLVFYHKCPSMLLTIYSVVESELRLQWKCPPILLRSWSVFSVCSFFRSWSFFSVCSFVRSFVRACVRSWSVFSVRSFVRSWSVLSVRSLVRWFARSLFVRSFTW